MSVVNSGLSAAALGDQRDARRDQLRASLPIGRHRARRCGVAVHIKVNTALTGATLDIAGGQHYVQ
jgi:hypothetical protein